MPRLCGGASGPQVNGPSLTSAGWAGFLLRQPCHGGVSALCDAAECNLDDEFVGDLGSVVIEPFGNLLVVRVLRVGEDVELLIEAGDAAAVFGRSVALTGDLARIADAGLALTQLG